MTKTEVGDNSLLAAIKDQLELGIDDCLKVNDNGLREYGVTAGFGFPTPEGKTVINLGFEWKARQAHPNPMIKENYLNITLGVNFNEVWFFKRKIR